jgi:hypothetical protein
MAKETELPGGELINLATGLTSTFVLRTDLYARQLDDGSYVCIQKPLTRWHMIAHLKGELTLGVYALDTSSQARFIVFDADDVLQFEKLAQAAGKLACLGASGYLEASRRGGHLWLFLPELMPGKHAREFGKGLALVYNLGGIELFPKQSLLKNGPGSLVRLPFGVHRKTGKRYGFLTPGGEPLAARLAAQAELLCQPQATPAPVFEAYRQLGAAQPQKAEIAPSQAAQGQLSKRIKDSVNAQGFIGQYVQLNQHGRGLCPFHDDQKQSFSVNPEKNYWHCFAGCGGGSIIDFWMRWRKCSFKEALKELAGMLLRT